MSTSPDRAAPFPSPPGLEDAAGEVKACVLDGIEEKLKQLGAGTVGHEVFQAIRESVMAEVDSKVAEKADELWRRGQQAIVKMQEQHKEKVGRFADEVAKINARHVALEAENEKLKQVINTLHARFSLLGAVFGGKGGATSPDVVAALQPQVVAAASTPSPQATQEPAELHGAEAAALVASEAAKPLPEVPPFPFPGTSTPASGTPGSTVPTVSLAEALGAQTPQRTPLSLMQSLTPTPAPEVTGGSPYLGKQFSFTIRKADGADLGLNVSHHDQDKVLRVEGVRPEGAVEAWNRQCLTGSAKDKAVITGDRIIQVNNVSYDPAKMLEECRDKQLLKLTIQRGGSSAVPMSPAMPASPSPNAAVEATPPKASTTLRAEASVFVPGGAPIAVTTTAAATESASKEVEQSSDKQPGSPGKAQDTDSARV